MITNDIVLNAQTIITAAAFLSAFIAIFSVVFKVHKWYLKQEKQDEDIKALKDEQKIICSGVMACLDGLQQLGANHTVPTTKEMLEKHLNEQAHK